MLLIDNQGITSPSLNLALEEYVLRHFDMSEDYLFLYINEPSLVLGKHQNVWEEVNVKYAKEYNIEVIRRVSGGGTVYHELGNLNFSFITKYDKSKVGNYKYFLNPIVKKLNELGVPAEISPRNDIMANGFKISGNAQFSTTKSMLSHGTLLFDANLASLGEGLKVKDRIISKSVKSNRSKVTNIRTFLHPTYDISAFKEKIAEGIFNQDYTDITQRKISEEEWSRVEALSKDKYQTWEWNFARSPKCTIIKEKADLIIEIDVKKGIIEDIRFNQSNFESLKTKFVGLKYEEEIIDKEFL